MYANLLPGLLLMSQQLSIYLNTLKLLDLQDVFLPELFSAIKARTMGKNSHISAECWLERLFRQTLTPIPPTNQKILQFRSIRTFSKFQHRFIHVFLNKI